MAPWLSQLKRLCSPARVSKLTPAWYRLGLLSCRVLLLLLEAWKANLFRLQLDHGLSDSDKLRPHLGCRKTTTRIPLLQFCSKWLSATDLPYLLRFGSSCLCSGALAQQPLHPPQRH
jgi:hypothetical protein